MSNVENLPSDRRQEIHKLQDNELDAVTGGKYACIRAEWITIDDEGNDPACLLPVLIEHSGGKCWASADDCRGPQLALLEVDKFDVGAGDGNRTHDIQLGKLSFYH
jgi:hypothetical protein